MKIIKRQITEVENSEGCIFKIGDKIIKDHTNKSRTKDFETPSTIISFNIAKTIKGSKINAITDFKYGSGLTNKDGISIDKISLYIDIPLISEKYNQSNESLLDKAKRLYPIGTEFYAARGSKGYYKVRSNSEFIENPDGAICIESNGNGTIYFNSIWGEIIK